MRIAVTAVLIRDRVLTLMKPLIVAFCMLAYAGALCSVASPFIVRASLGVPVVGTPLHGTMFITLAAAELCLMSGAMWNSIFTMLWVYSSFDACLHFLSSACGEPLRVGSASDVEKSGSAVQRTQPPGIRITHLQLDYVTDYPRCRRTQEQLERMRAAVRGALTLDNVLAIQSTRDVLRSWILNISQGAASSVSLLSSIAPTLAVLIASALALSFTISANSTSSLQIMQYQVRADAARQAAIVPTVTMLISFLVNCVMLLVVVFVSGRAVRRLRRLSDIVQDALCATIAVLEDVRARTASLKQIGAASTALERVTEVEVLDSYAQELRVVIDAQRALKEYISDLIADSAGIRLFGCLRPGSFSFGGVFAIMVSAATLAVRLIASASDAIRVST